MYRPVILLLASLLVAAAPAPEVIKKERDKLLGMWGIVSELGPVPNSERGLPILKFTAEKVIASRVAVEAGKLVFKDEKEVGTYTIDPTTNPKTIDIKLTTDPGKGKTSRGIYQLRDDDLTLCLGEPDAARPVKFVRSKEVALMVCKRSTPEAQQKAIAAIEAMLLQARVSLPFSRTAKWVDPKAADQVLLDVTSESRIEAAGQKDPLSALGELRFHLREQFTAMEKKAGAGQVKTVVVVRADKRAEVMPLYHVAETAMSQGFPRVQLQVLGKPGQESRLDLPVPHWRRPDSFSDFTVQVKPIRDGVNDGSIAALIVQSGSDEEAVPSLAGLEKHLKQKREELKGGKQESVRISAEGRLNVGSLVDVIDACLSAGFAAAIFGPPTDMEVDRKAGARVPPPDAATQAKADKEIKAIYQAQYAQLDPAALSRRLRQAGEICDDPAAKFVLLREAADAAGRAGNVPASLDVLDLLAKEYIADVWRMKLDKFKNAPGTKEIAEAALKQAGNASVQGRLDYGVRFLKLAENAAKQTKDKDLLQFVEERRVLFKLPQVDDLDPFSPVPISSLPVERPATKKAEAKPPATQDDSSSELQSMILWYVLPGGAAIVLLGAGLFMWLRRGDAAVRSRLRQARKGEFQMPVEESAENPPPPPPAGQGPTTP